MHQNIELLWTNPDVILLIAGVRFLIVWSPLALGLFFLALAWRGDPSRGRRRCRKCWHSMDGLPHTEAGWTCPECGTVTKRERALRRAAPRRWMRRLYLAFFALAPLPWYTGLVIERWPDEGRASLVPSTIAALAYPDHINDIRTPGSFGARVDALLVERQYGEELWPLHRWLAGTPEYDLAPYDPMDYIDFPTAWVRGEPIVLSVERLHDHFWSQTVYSQEVTLRTGRTGGSSVNYTVYAHPYGWGGGQMGEHYASRFVHPSAGDESEQILRVHLRVQHEIWPVEPGFASELRHLHTSRALVEIEMLDTWDEALNGGVQSPMYDPAIDAWLLATPQISIHQIGGYIFLGGADRMLLANGTPGPPFDTNLVYDVVLMDGDEEIHRDAVAQSWKLWEDNTSPPDDLGLRLLGEDDEAFRANLERMTVRLVPRPRRALGQFLHDTYWLPADGSAYLELTLLEALTVPPRLGSYGGWFDPLNPPSPYVRELPW